MTEFQYYEAIMMAVELSALAAMNFLAIVAMYLIAAFVIGSKPPKSIAVATSLIYTMFLIPPLVGTAGNMNRAFRIGGEAQTTYPDSVLFESAGSVVTLDAYLLLFSIPMIAGWLGSIYFMHKYVRSGKA